ncbi:hypothetical protein Q7P37_003857 [Cladosporium fusiforme]
MPRRSGHRKPPPQKKPPLTHFLCLPLVTAASKPQLEASIKSFRDDVTTGESKHINETANEFTEAPSRPTEAIGQVHPKAIRPIGALHCTLGVMSLDSQQLAKAIDLLENIDIEQKIANALPRADHTSNSDGISTESNYGARDIASLNRPISPPATSNHSSSTQTQPIKINLRGLVSMHAPQNTSILYTAPQDPSERLYNFCLALQGHFKEQNLLVSDDRKLKLHATLVNTIYAKGKKRLPPRRSIHQPSGAGALAQQAGGQHTSNEDRSEGHGPNSNAPLKIDARPLLEKYKDFIWADNVVLDRVAICEMGTKKKTDGQGNITAEEYTEVASVPLPT